MTTYRSTSPRLVQALLWALVAVAAALTVAGCRSESASSLVVERRMDVKPSGEIVYTHKVNGKVQSVSTENPAAPTTQAVTEHGVFASVAGEQVKSSKDFAAEKQAELFGWAAIIATIAAAALVWPAKQYVLASAVGVAAIVFYGYQALQNPLVLYGLLGSLIFVGWYALRRSKRLKNGEPVTTARDATIP